MKKYFIAVAALALVACSGKQAAKDAPVEVAEEDVVVTEQAIPINMRDSLNIQDGLGAVIEQEYEGVFPAADGPGIDYDLALFYQENSGDGVYELTTTYLEADQGKDKAFKSTGKRRTLKGSATNKDATVYELIPSDGSISLFFLVEGDSLTMLNKNLEKAASDLNYSLKLKK